MKGLEDINLKELYSSVVEGDSELCQECTTRMLREGYLPEDMLMKAMIPAMDFVGESFQRMDFYIPELIISARAMRVGMEILRPELIKQDVQAKGRVAIGTVRGDLHDIGKNLVGIMLEGAGYEIIDLGTDVDKSEFVNHSRQGVDIIALSALLTTTVSNMEEVIRAIDEEGFRDQVKIIVGGAPVTLEFASSIGADGYASEAIESVKVVKELLNHKQ